MDFALTLCGRRGRILDLNPGVGATHCDMASKLRREAADARQLREKITFLWTTSNFKAPPSRGLAVATGASIRYGA
jgi:hypothetical protein